eukprot:882270-Amphidinium_carterae.1
MSPMRRGHNLEDHYDYAEFICRMHNPLGAADAEPHSLKTALSATGCHLEEFVVKCPLERP